MKSLEKKARTYRLPETTTPEDLETRFYTSSATFLTFGNKILMAGYFWNGPKNPCYYGAVFAFKTEDHTCEGEIKLMAASEVAFEDNGHAIAWAMAH
jgi:hypothetical protein